MSDWISPSCTTNSARILYVRLPCNPIFPVGVVYLADHIGKVLPQVEQRILDLGTVPPLDFRRTLDRVISEFQPTVLVYSWRDIQIYAPVGGRGGNPLQNAFAFYYARNPPGEIAGCLGGGCGWPPPVTENSGAIWG